MKKIDHTNIENALSITQEAFAHNKSLLWFIRNDAHRQQRLRELCGFCINTSLEKNGAFITNDGNGVLLCYISDKKINPFRNLLLSLRFLYYSGNLLALPRLLKRQTLTRQIRGQEKHIYVLLMASNHKNGMETAVEMKEFLFRMSDYLQLPIYAEASQTTNRLVYERYGFKTYQTATLPGSEVKLWFLRKQNIAAT